MGKLIKLSAAALLLCAVALPAIGQDSKARTVSLKTKHVAGQIHTETEEESGTQKIELGGGVATRNTDTVTVKKKLTEVIEVGADGQITKARVTWESEKTTTTTQDFGEEKPGEPAETEGAKTGASILYTWNAEKKAWDATLEKGDAEEDDIKKELKHTGPFLNPLIAERDVKIGEEWEPTEADMKKAFPPADNMEILEMKATCKAEEIVKEGEKEFLRVSFNIDIKGKLKDESMSDPEFTANNKGSFLWDIALGRAASVEAEQSMGFEAEVTTPQGKVAAKFEGTGKSIITITYAAKEEKKDGK
jgi:hypothetical protein